MCKKKKANEANWRTQNLENCRTTKACTALGRTVHGASCWFILFNQCQDGQKKKERKELHPAYSFFFIGPLGAA